MTTGFGSCPSCGTPKVASDQVFCAGCGASFPGAPPPATQAWPTPPTAPQPPATPAWPTPPTAPQPPAPQPWPPTAPAWPPDAAQASPPAPQAWPMPPDAAQPPDYQPADVAGYPQGYPPAYPGYPGYPGYAPAQSRTGLIAAIGIGILIFAILAIVGAALLIGSGSGSSSGIVYSPQTVTCGQAYTLTIRLPASVKESDRLTVEFDGKTAGTETVSSGFVKQPDGSWLYQDSTATGTWQCGSSGSSSVGSHTERILDSKGKVLAEGKYTLK